MENKIDSMNATGEASGNLLLNEMGYPHHVDFQKQHEHDQETMRLMSDEINRLRKIIANQKG
jgi:hypothetical protein